MSALSEWAEIDDTHSKASRSLTVDAWTIEWGRRARAAIESLKCCGNCKWFRAVEYQNCGHPDVPTDEQGEYYISAPDKCDFSPSRWKERP